MAGVKRPAEIGLDEVITKPKLQQLLRQVARHPKDALDEDAEEVCVCLPTFLTVFLPARPPARPPACLPACGSEDAVPASEAPAHARSCTLRRR